MTLRNLFMSYYRRQNTAAATARKRRRSPSPSPSPSPRRSSRRSSPSAPGRSSPSLGPNAAQTRIAAAFRGHLARRPTNLVTLNAIPGRRRVQIGTKPHDASSIAELMRRGNWRDPHTREALTNAQAEAAWRLHVRNAGAEARRSGRHYSAPAMPQRPSAGAVNSHRVGNIMQWYYGGNGTYSPPPTAAVAGTYNPAMAAVAAEIARDAANTRREQTAAKTALKRAWTAILQNPGGAGGTWRGQRFSLTRFQHNNRETSWKFNDAGREIALVQTIRDSVRVTPAPERYGWGEWAREMEQHLTGSFRFHRLVRL